MLAAFVLTAGAGAVFFFAAGFWLLLLAQLLMVMSRAMYWPASWSLGSELPGGRSLQMGRLNAITNTGQIMGMTGAGLSLLWFGFGPVVPGARRHGLSFASRPPLAGKAEKHGAQTAAAVSGYAQLIRLRVIPFAIMCAYISALPFFAELLLLPDPAGRIRLLRGCNRRDAGAARDRFGHGRAGHRALSRLFGQAGRAPGLRHRHGVVGRADRQHARCLDDRPADDLRSDSPPAS